MIPLYPVGQYDRNLSTDLNRVTPGPVLYIALNDASKNVGIVLSYIFQPTFLRQVDALLSVCGFSYVCLLFEHLKQITRFRKGMPLEATRKE
jgi:hypothetical protein